MEENDRARGIYELAIEQNLDMPENVWKAYIDFEITLANYENVRLLYRRLLEKTKHIKVFLSYAKFELSINENERARRVFLDSYNYFKKQDSKEERLMILENWLAAEQEMGVAEHIDFVKGKMPKRLKKRRKVKLYNEEMLQAMDEQQQQQMIEETGI